MMYRITVCDQAGTTVFREEFADDSQFYVGSIDRDGNFSSFGRAKPSSEEFVQGIRKWARDWAMEQDLKGFFQELRDLLIKESIKAGNIQAQNFLQAVDFSFEADRLHALLTEIRLKTARHFEEMYGTEQGGVFFLMAWEALFAMVSRLKEENGRVHTVWEYPASVLTKNQVETVLEWLFRKVGDGGKH